MPTFVHVTEMMIENISHVLVIATPLEIILLGVSAGKGNALPGNTLYTTYLSVPSDNVSMTSIHGSSSGRIFMTGSDGHVYEMEYQVCHISLLSGFVYNSIVTLYHIAK